MSTAHKLTPEQEATAQVLMTAVEKRSRLIIAVTKERVLLKASEDPIASESQRKAFKAYAAKTHKDADGLVESLGSVSEIPEEAQRLLISPQEFRLSIREKLRSNEKELQELDRMSRDPHLDVEARAPMLQFLSSEKEKELKAITTLLQDIRIPLDLREAIYEYAADSEAAKRRERLKFAQESGITRTTAENIEGMVCATVLAERDILDAAIEDPLVSENARSKLEKRKDQIVEEHKPFHKNDKEEDEDELLWNAIVDINFDKKRREQLFGGVLTKLLRKRELMGMLSNVVTQALSTPLRTERVENTHYQDLGNAPN
jgi:hypothetical protein